MGPALAARSLGLVIWATLLGVCDAIWEVGYNEGGGKTDHNLGKAPCRRFVLISQQRSGTRFFIDKLKSHPDVGADGELFFHHQDVPYDWSKMRQYIDADMYHYCGSNRLPTPRRELCVLDKGINMRCFALCLRRVTLHAFSLRAQQTNRGRLQVDDQPGSGRGARARRDLRDRRIFSFSVGADNERERERGRALVWRGLPVFSSPREKENPALVFPRHRREHRRSSTSRRPIPR